MHIITNYLKGPIRSLISVLTDYRDNPSTFLLYSFVVREGSRCNSIPFTWNYELNRIEYVTEKWKLCLWKLSVLTQWTVAVIHVLRFRYSLFKTEGLNDKVVDALVTTVHLCMSFYSINSVVGGKDVAHFINSVTEFDTKWMEMTSAKALRSCSILSDCFIIMMLLSGYVITPLVLFFYWSDPCRSVYPMNSMIFGSSCKTMNKIVFLPGAIFEWLLTAGSMSLFSFYTTTLFVTGQRPLYRLSQISNPHVMKELMANNSTTIPKLYRMIAIVYKIQEYCFRYIMNTVTSSFLYFMYVLTFFCTLTLYEALSLEAYLVFPTSFLGTAIILYSIIETYGKIHHSSLRFLHTWRSQLPCHLVWQRKFLKSCCPLRIMKGNQQIRKTTVLSYYNSAFNDTSSLLIST